MKEAAVRDHGYKSFPDLKTRSLPALARSYARHFTFYLAHPIRSIPGLKAWPLHSLPAVAGIRCSQVHFALGSSLRRDTATSTRDACATQIRVHSCRLVVRVR
jgi:hypothetical protein